MGLPNLYTVESGENHMTRMTAVATGSEISAAQLSFWSCDSLRSQLYTDLAKEVSPEESRKRLSKVRSHVSDLRAQAEPVWPPAQYMGNPPVGAHVSPFLLPVGGVRRGPQSRRDRRDERRSVISGD